MARGNRRSNHSRKRLRKRSSKRCGAGRLRRTGKTRSLSEATMLTISKPLSAGQARAYHAEEFGNARENYYTEGERITGEWHGKLAEEWGLRGEVREENFQRLSEAQHPITGEQLVRYQTPREYVNEQDEKIKTMEH